MCFLSGEEGSIAGPSMRTQLINQNLIENRSVRRKALKLAAPIKAARHKHGSRSHAKSSSRQTASSGRPKDKSSHKK